MSVSLGWLGSMEQLHTVGIKGLGLLLLLVVGAFDISSRSRRRRTGWFTSDVEGGVYTIAETG
eukprot:3977823-Amphidinium_carterae.1